MAWNWKSIETAPKDKWIMIWQKSFITPVAVKYMTRKTKTSKGGTKEKIGFFSLRGDGVKYYEHDNPALYWCEIEKPSD